MPFSDSLPPVSLDPIHRKQIVQMSAKGLCGQCNGPANRQCTTCFEGVDVYGDELRPTLYCSEACEKVHGQQGGHEAACRQAQDRKQLYRAGRFVQAHFDEFSRLSYQVLIDRFESGAAGTRLQVFAGLKPTLLVDFPDHYFAHDKNRKAMLVWNQCNDSMLRMRDFVGRSLEGKCGRWLLARQIKSHRCRPSTTPLQMISLMLC